MTKNKKTEMRAFGVAARRRRDRSYLGDGFMRENFIMGPHSANDRARAYFSQYPPSTYLSEVESWQKLPDGRVAFIMRRLPSIE
jgi:hypothetical protein